MMFLEAFPPLAPEWGQFIWTTIIFLIVWLIIGRTAFKPISNALKKRENSIQDALDAADKAKKEMESLQAENERLLQEAREERTKIIHDAKEAADTIVKEARDKAKHEAKLISENAQREIESQKQSALKEVKKEVGTMAVSMAEKIMRKELKNADEQKALIDKFVQEMNQN